MDKIFFSIIVLTYNSDLQKIRRTLYSIIKQEKVSFEIIVADDGSRNNYFDSIEDYFKIMDFKNYRLVPNSENKGIVQNVLSGLRIANGEIVKLISPGDFLYDENVLFNAFSFISRNEASVYFTDNIYYSYNCDDIEIFENHKNPKNLYPYIKAKNREIKWNYLYNHDYILGAGVFEKRLDLLTALEIIKDFVVYSEDSSIIYLVAKNKKVSFIDMIGVWYEDGSGISTAPNSAFQKALIQDNKNMYIYLLNNKLISRNCFNASYGKNVIARLFHRVISSPIYFLKNFIRCRFTASKKVFGWQSSNWELNKLKNILNQ